MAKVASAELRSCGTSSPECECESGSTWGLCGCCAFFHAWILLCQVEDFELTSGVDYIILETLDCHDNREFGQMESTCLTEAKKSLIQETYILPIPVPSISYTFCGSRELGNLSAPVDCLRAMSPVFSVKKSKRELAA